MWHWVSCGWSTVGGGLLVVGGRWSVVDGTQQVVGVGGTWSNGGTLCRVSGPVSVAAPANYKDCEQMILYESFSFNDTSLLGTQGGSATATTFNASAWSTTASARSSAN